MDRASRLIELNALTAIDIAKAIYNVSGGDRRKISVSNKQIQDEDSFWGKVVNVLIPSGVNSRQDRKLLQGFWLFNRKSVQVSFKPYSLTLHISCFIFSIKVDSNLLLIGVLNNCCLVDFPTLGTVQFI